MTRCMKCVIIANGQMGYDRRTAQIVRTAELIICADGGARHLKALDIFPHIMIGDFDSVAQDDLDLFSRNNVRLIRFPSQKDQTDSELCIDWAMENKATDITLLGMTGTRMDHTLANIFLLKKLAQKNIPARMIDQHNEIHAVINNIQLKGKIGEILSLIPITDSVTGITTTGLEYPLENDVMHMGSSLGVSNVFKQTDAFISVRKGILLVIRAKD